MFRQVLRQYRATVGYVSVVDDEIHALTVCRHGIRRGQVRRTEDHELVTALIERTLTQEGQHKIRIERGAIESPIEHKEAIRHLAQILQRLELIRHHIGGIPESL